ncbi:hypothetical protein SEVCU122_2325, partial [Staphylococcus hominis VCU122]
MTALPWIRTPAVRYASENRRPNLCRSRLSDCRNKSHLSPINVISMIRPVSPVRIFCRFGLKSEVIIMIHSDLSQCRVNTDRLLIAPFTAADADDVYQAITPTLTRFMNFEPEESPEAFANVWQTWLPLIREGEELIFVARLRDSKEFVGMGGLHDLHNTTPE